MGPAKRGARSAYKRFGGAKTLPEAEFISAEDEKNWGPHPILIGWGAPAPESTWSAARADGRDRCPAPQRAGMGIDEILQRLKRTKSGRERHWGRGYDTELKEA